MIYGDLNICVIKRKFKPYDPQEMVLFVVYINILGIISYEKKKKQESVSYMNEFCQTHSNFNRTRSILDQILSTYFQ
jgi:hypothetical protein